LWPVKLNTVVKRGVNDQGLVDLACFARANGLIVRFIEYMDVGTTNGWRLDDVVPAAEVIRRIDAELLWSRLSRTIAARSRAAGDSATGRGDRRDRVGHAAVLPRLRSGAPVDRRQAVPLPVLRRQARLAGPAAPGRQQPRAPRGAGRIWRGRGDRYSQLCAALPVRPASIELSDIGG
jgi:cyclic pyranopterin phosphate synthase